MKRKVLCTALPLIIAFFLAMALTEFCGEKAGLYFWAACLGLWVPTAHLFRITHAPQEKEETVYKGMENLQTESPEQQTAVLV